ncbi:MAG: transporter [Cyclobacteriaceae bacterium]|nr:MAG: transporter [Cyclobacteriaceae bacterium]
MKAYQNLFSTGLILVTLSGPLICNAQQRLTLDDCVQIGLANNISIKKVNNNFLIAEANEKQSKLEYLPRVSASSNYNISHGLTNDPTTFEPVTATTKSSTPSLNMDFNIFNGMRTRNFARKSTMVRQAADFDAAQTRDDIELAITASYLLVISDRENIKVAQERLDLLSNQLNRAERRVEAGVANMEQVFNLRSQIANEKLNKVTLENQYKSDRLSLLQTLLLDPSLDYRIEDVSLLSRSIDTTIPEYQELLKSVLAYSPGLKSAGLGIEASKLDLAMAKADRLPSLNMRAAYGSTFSSNNQDGYLDQLNLNEQKFLGLALNIPIFDRNRIKNNVHVSNINISNTELDYEQVRIDLVNSMQQAYLDLVAAHSTYEAARENLSALEQSFKFAESRYNSGNTDFYSYLESLNNKNRAEIDLINSRYSFLFRQRILEIYQGL